MFDKELSQTRKAMDDVAKEKAKAEIELERHKINGQELQSKLEEKGAEIGRMEWIQRSLESQLEDTKKKAEDAGYEKKRLVDELKYIKSEHLKLQNKLTDAVKNLENETLYRIDIQNHLQTVKEEHKFENSMLEQKLKETTTRKQVEVEEVEGKAREQYELKMQTSLQELRDSYEQQMAESRAGFSAMYNKKIQDLQDKLSGEKSSVAAAVQEMKEMSTKVEAVTSRVKELEVNNHVLQSRVKELQV